MSEFGDIDTQRALEEKQFGELRDSLHNPPPGPTNKRLVEGSDPTLTGALEIRQIAGLTSGTVLPLDRGSFHFRNGDNEIQFTLHIESRSRVMVVPGKGFLRINDQDLDGPTRLGSGVLDVGNARFIVRQRSTERRILGDELLTESQPVISVPTFGGMKPSNPSATPLTLENNRTGGLIGGFTAAASPEPESSIEEDVTQPEPAPSQKSRWARASKTALGGANFEFNPTTGRWGKTGKTPDQVERPPKRPPAKLTARKPVEYVQTSLDGTSWEFLEDIRDVRNGQASQYRALHPHPEEAMYRLKSGGNGLWNREPHHSLFGRVSIACADLAWSPLFDNPDAIPAVVRPHIGLISSLPSVPVTANLPIGPLGIFGYRSSALAVARQALLAIATTSKPGTFEFGVFANDDFVEDWEWVNKLPERFFLPGHNSQTFVFADGTLGYQRASELHPIAQREAGVIVVSDTIDNLPPDCGTVIQVDDVGYCRVTNHLGEMLDATPLGVTEEFADKMSLSITAALS